VTVKPELETITAGPSGNCLMCGMKIPSGDERLNLEADDPELKVKVGGEVCRRSASAQMGKRARAQPSSPKRSGWSWSTSAGKKQPRARKEPNTGPKEPRALVCGAQGARVWQPASTPKPRRLFPSIFLDDREADKLSSMRGEGESYNDVIMRVAQAAKPGRRRKETTQ
jgi:hypothetical protein